MTDKEIKDCNCEADENCECGDDCDCDSNTITLELEDGPHEFQILSSVQIKGKHYLALSEVGSLEYDIFGMTEDGDSIELSYVDDDDEFNAAADEFEKIFGEEFEELDSSLEK